MLSPDDVQPSAVPERRSAHRHPGRSDLRCEVIDLLDETAAEACPWNVGQGGLCVLIEPHYEFDTPVEVQLRPRGAGPFLKRIARVTFSLPTPSAREMFLTGCAFDSDPLPDEAIESLI